MLHNWIKYVLFIPISVSVRILKYDIIFQHYLFLQTIKKNILKKLENLIKQITLTRKRLGITQVKMAAALGVSQQVYGNIESGRTKRISSEIYTNFSQLIKGGGENLIHNSSEEDKIATLTAAVKIITMEVMQLRSKSSGESIAVIHSEYEKLISEATKKS